MCETRFTNYGRRTAFHGRIVTFATFEDNDGVRALLQAGGSGKVLVIDGRGSVRRALCGGNVAALAAVHGWAGLVVNGCIRDAHEIADLDLGVKAVGATPLRPRPRGVGEADVPVRFGGVTFQPGAYLYADDDGVVVTEAAVHETPSS